MTLDPELAERGLADFRNVVLNGERSNGDWNAWSSSVFNEAHRHLEAARSSNRGGGKSFVAGMVADFLARANVSTLRPTDVVTVRRQRSALRNIASIVETGYGPMIDSVMRRNQAMVNAVEGRGGSDVHMTSTEVRVFSGVHEVDDRIS